jgi:hypothetical protein
LLNERVTSWRRGVENETVVTQRAGKSADGLTNGGHVIAALDRSDCYGYLR